MTNKVNRQMLISMLAHMRPAYSTAEKAFCQEFLEPIFGMPDVHGNYILIQGITPDIMYTAHTDTVHTLGGIQKLKIENDFVSAVNSNCLGADCTAGLWLMLSMIEAGVDGVYCAFAAEELGGIGSTNLVIDNPDWLDNINACISFDRYGTNSIITHQAGIRTASDEFASSLAEVLDLSILKPDSTGLYTDSCEFADIVPECTNLSVGYDHHHTSLEKLDLHFIKILADRLCKADWSTLQVFRDPTLLEYQSDALGYLSGSLRGHTLSSMTDDEQDDIYDLKLLMVDRPESVAKLLISYGLTAEALEDELGLDDNSVFSNYY